MVNFICSCGLNLYQFCEFLSETEAECSFLPYHTKFDDSAVVKFYCDFFFLILGPKSKFVNENSQCSSTCKHRMTLEISFWDS